MTAYDVRVENAAGTAGDGVRVEADDEAGAATAALAQYPDEWVVPADGISEAAGHGEAWGVDLTADDAPAEPIAVEGGAGR